MTGTQITLVKASFKKIELVEEEAAVLFYARLFELDPTLRRLFKEDMSEQRFKLMQMLEFAVQGLENLEELVPAVRALGARHVGYGVRQEHYETVGSALLWTFGHALGEEFTAEMKEAWTAVYNLLAKTMQDGASQVPEKASGGST